MKRTFILLAGLLVVVALLFINASKPVNGLKIGDVAPDFSLPNIDGKNVSMASYEDAKGFVVIFTCNTCPYAKAYESRIVALDKKYAAKGFPVIAINPNDLSKKPDDSMKDMKVRAEQKGFTFPYLRDDSQNIATQYGATKTPHVYVLNKKQEGLIVEYIGAIDDSANDAADVSEEYVASVIDALLVGQEPPYREKRAIGCTIKWKES